MGQAGSNAHVVLSSEVQLHFKALGLKKEVAEIVKAWFEDGAPLGLTPESFELLVRVEGSGDSQSIFGILDTDHNNKVDALEVLSATILLSSGTVDEKAEMVFQIFDFSGSGRLNFDEVNILVHSVCRGLHKICGTQAVCDTDIMDIVRLMFDSHNLPYEKQISKEQVRRWLRADVDAAGFIDVYHNSHSLSEVEAGLAQRERAQATAFAEMCSADGGTAVAAECLLKSGAFRHTLDDPDEEALQSFVALMSKGGKDVGLERFAEASRAWNVFTAVDGAGDGVVEAKEFVNLLWLQHRERPDMSTVEKQREALGLKPGDRIARATWVAANLRAMAS